MISKQLQQAKEAIAENNSYKLFGALCSPSVLLVAALAGVGLVIPGWILYRTISYQLTRDTCLEYKAARIDQRQIRQKLGLKSWPAVDKVCEFYK